MTKIRSAYARGEDSPLDFTDVKGRTRQSHKAECDINNILRNYAKTGAIAHVNRYAPQYGEVPAYDLRRALEIMQDATKMFADLPAVLRKKFENDAAKFLEYVQDPANQDEMVKLGLATRREPAVAPAVAAPAAPAPGAGGKPA